MATNLAKWILTADDKTKAAFDSVGKNLKKTDLDIAAFATRAAGLFGVAFGAQAIVTNIVSVEKLKASLTSVTGSVETAAQKFEELQEFAGKTPFSLDEIVRGFNKMSVLGLNPTIADMTSLGNTSAALGKTLEQFIDAVADAGTNQFERLNEFGIKAKQSSESVEFTFGGVTTKVGKNAKEIVGYLTNIGETRFAGAMQLQADTLGGAFSQLGNKAIELSEALGEAGLSALLKGVAEFMGLVAERTLTTKRLLGELFDEKRAIGLSNRTAVLVQNIELLQEELDEVNKKAPDWDMSVETREPRRRAIELREMIAKNRTELDSVNERLAGIQATYEKAAAKLKGKLTTTVDVSAPEEPKVSEKFKKFLEDFKDNDAVIAEFTDRVTFLNAKFNAGELSAARYAEQVNAVAGEVKLLGTQSADEFQVKLDKDILKEFSKGVTVLNREFNAGRLTAERYSDEINSISGDVQKLGVPTLEIDLKIDSDSKILREFVEEMEALNTRFNSGAISAARYTEQIKSVSGEVEKIGKLTPEIDLKFKTDADLMRPAIEDITALNKLFLDGSIGVTRYESEMERVAKSLEGVGRDEEELNKKRERAKTIIEGLRTPMQEYSADIIEIEKLWRDNIITIEQYYVLVDQRSKEFVDKQKEKATDWEKHWASAFDRFSGGVGDAVADAMFEQEKFSDVMRGVVKGVLKQVVSGLVEIGVKKLALAAIEKVALGSHTVASKTAAALTATSWAPAAAAVSLATLGGNSVPASAGLAATFALSQGLALAGQAHDGLDAVPKTGTYILEKGERVVKKEDNEALTKLIEIEMINARERSKRAPSFGAASARAVTSDSGANRRPSSFDSSLAQIFGSASVRGQAHDGLDAVPKTGTYILEKGERVVKKEDNEALTKLIEIEMINARERSKRAPSFGAASARAVTSDSGANRRPSSFDSSLAQIFGSASVRGQAHDGLDMVPRDGTYLLEKGERVVKKEDNQELKKLIRSGQAGGNVVNVSTTINASGSGAANDIRALIPLIESTSVAAVQRAMHERGRRGPLG